MSGLPHISDPAAIPRLLRLVQNTPTPQRVTVKHLHSNGFSAVEGPHLVGLLRAIKFVDKGSHPTKCWTEYRSAPGAHEVLADAVRTAYQPLFDALGEPDTRDDEELAGAIRKVTRFGEQHVQQTVSSFRTLCLAAGIGSGRSRSEVLRDVAELSAMSSAEFDAAHRALHHGLLRPAHVAGWNGYVATALMRMAKDDFQALRDARPNWTVLSVNDVAMRVPGSALIDLLVDLELLDGADKDALRGLLQRRNDCAHPTSFAPTIEQTTAYLDDLLERSVVLSRHPIG